MFTAEQLENVQSRAELVALAGKESANLKKALSKADYEEELKLLQTELAMLLEFIQKQQLRLAVIFEGRDAAGKGGAIKRFIEHLNPQASGIVALSKPTDVEKGQWYFQRYIEQLPDRGHIRFFDRSWYNRAVVEPVMGFCTEKQYETFMRQVPNFEHMLYEDGITVIKLAPWIEIDEETRELELLAAAEHLLKSVPYAS